METLIAHLPYVGVAGILILSGFGLPLPEDIPLLLGGYMCAQGNAELAIMLPVCLVCVVGADLLIFTLGRHYGYRVASLPILRRLLSPARLAKAADALHEHSGKTLFVARFLPGLRTPVFFTAGTFRIPPWKMLLADGAAALISVPIWVVGAYLLADQITLLKQLGKDLQFALLALVAVVILVVVLWRRRRARKRAMDKSGSTSESDHK